MVNKINQCIVLLDKFEVDSECRSASVGKAVFYEVKKAGRRNKGLFNYDYYVSHLLFGRPVNLIRGVVESIKAVFVERTTDGYSENPCNRFTIFEASYIDGARDAADYQGRNPHDVAFYILVLKDAAIYPYQMTIYSTCKYQIELDMEGGSKELFWNRRSDKVIGDVNGIRLSKDEYISFDKQPWQRALSEWIAVLSEHIDVDQWNKLDWTDWWAQGWGFAKEIIKLLPDGAMISYGYTRGNDVVLPYQGAYGGDQWITIFNDLTNKLERGIYFPKVKFNNYIHDEATLLYETEIDKPNHHFFPYDRIVLCKYGSNSYLLGTIDRVTDKSIVIKTDRTFDISDEYSIELII